MDEEPAAHADPMAFVKTDDGLLGKLMNSLPPDVREKLLSQARLCDLPAETVILDVGKVSSEIGYVIDGMLGMVQIVDHERRHIIGLLVPTDLYGRVFDGPTSYRVETLAPTRVLTFPRAAFEQILLQHPEVERMFLVHLLDEMDAAREWLLMISGRLVINRVAAFLMILARRARSAMRGEVVTLHLPLSRKDLAHYLGTRKESLSRAFHELQDKGIVRIITPEIFEILDLAALTAVSGDDLTVDGD